MEKSVGIALKDFPTTPSSLREVGTRNEPRDEVSIQLASLYHHYYLDSHGRTPPNPDPAQFEHLEFLLPCADFRIRGDGIGASTAIRRHRSNEFGHAFCRWFLHEHLNITYFAHMEHVLNRSLHDAFGGLKIVRIARGDTPDYFCAEDVNRVFLAEAKGRHTAVSFGNADFSKWRNQFARVEVRDRTDTPRSIKGFIVATRFGTETKPSVKSTIFAEDPQSPGERALGPDEGFGIGRMVIASHYAGIALKLGQPILATALANGFITPEEIRYPATIWEFQVPPLAGKRFVGGYFPSASGALPIKFEDGRITYDRRDPLRLDVGNGTFFGVEEMIFRQVAALTRGAPEGPANVGRFENIQPFYSGVSILRDGSIVGPIEFFTPVATDEI